MPTACLARAPIAKIYNKQATHPVEEPLRRDRRMTSKRISNVRVKIDLVFVMRYPSYREGLESIFKGTEELFDGSIFAFSAAGWKTVFCDILCMQMRA